MTAGAVGNIDYYSQEYGSQDFFGLIDEMRIWRTVRTEEQIKQVSQRACQPGPSIYCSCPEHTFCLPWCPLQCSRAAGSIADAMG